MKRFFVIAVALVAVLSCYADERGVEIMQRIGRRYSSLNTYSLTFSAALPDGTSSGGELSVSGNKLYLKMADNEIFVEDTVRYEVHSRQREIIIDRADAYDKESFNPLKGVDGLMSKYNVEYIEVDRALRLTPKTGNSDVIHIYMSVDGESVERVTLGGGDNIVTIVVSPVKYTTRQPAAFNRAQYSGYEVIDFR